MLRRSLLATAVSLLIVPAAVAQDYPDRTITMTRLFDAPRELVWEAMSRPEHIKEWWGRLGEGYSVPVCEVDLRVGGKWRFVNRTPGHGDVAFSGVYREIAPPSRIVFTEIFDVDMAREHPSLVTTTFTETDGKTTVRILVRYDSKETRDIVLQSGMESGAAAGYDMIEEMLAKRLAR